MRQYLHNLARYDAWANDQLIQSLLSVAGADQRVLHLAGHLLAAKRVWLARIDGEDTFAWDLWPSVSIETFSPMLRDADQRLLAVTSSGATDFGQMIHYRNQTGRYFDTKLADIVIHIVNHASYHRGQLATAVKNAGGQPAVTDYIAWIRSFTAKANESSG